MECVVLYVAMLLASTKMVFVVVLLFFGEHFDDVGCVLVCMF